jgi:hypothetical protein
MQHYFKIQNLKVTVISDNSIVKSKEVSQLESKKPGFSTKLYQTIKIKGYEFYLKGTIKANYKNSNFLIKYPAVSKKNKEDKDIANYTNECDVILEISEKIPLGKFELNQDDRDMSHYAYNIFLFQIRNILKFSKFWITKNKIYNKKYNLNEDSSQWEGWTIEARTCDPFYTNLIFLFFRRKYIPPGMDTFQNITIILQEKCSSEFYEINPEAYNLIYLIGNSLHTINITTHYEYSGMIRAKIDALLVDEESLIYYQNEMGLIGVEIYKLAYEFIYILLTILNEGSSKEKVSGIKAQLENKMKSFSTNTPIEISK